MKKHIKKIALAVAIMLGALILVAVGYVIYVAADYSRMQDNLPLAVKDNGTEVVSLGTEYTIMTYNIGFGAYSSDYSFFMDSSKLVSGKKYKGKYGTARSKEEVLKNTVGIADTMAINGPDFVFAQEVDEDGTRSRHVDQRALFEDKMGYGSVYAKNFHSAYLYYPFNDPHGKNTSGLLTLSKYKIDSAIRRSLPVSKGIDKFFDLDRCFSVSRLSVGESELVLVNLHLSAYDKGGVIREKQMQVLFEFLETESQKGNYVVAGGDFNHDICDSAGTFPTQEVRPDWVATLPELPSGYSVAKADNSSEVPTCRSAAMPYTKGVNYTVIIDGFIVSDNIEVITTKNLNTEFEFSDHNPVLMEFSLKETV